MRPDELAVFAALEEARSWDYNGVNSQDLEAIKGMEDAELAEYFESLKSYNRKKHAARLRWEQNRRERQEEWQKNPLTWREIKPKPWRWMSADEWKLVRRWEEQDDIARKGE